MARISIIDMDCPSETSNNNLAQVESASDPDNEILKRNYGPCQIMCCGIIFAVVLSLITSMFFGLYFLITSYKVLALAIGFTTYFLIWIIAYLSSIYYDKNIAGGNVKTRRILLWNRPFARADPGFSFRRQFISTNRTMPKEMILSRSSSSQLSLPVPIHGGQEKHPHIKLPFCFSSINKCNSLTEIHQLHRQPITTTPKQYQQSSGEPLQSSSTTSLKSKIEIVKKDKEVLDAEEGNAGSTCKKSNLV